MKATPLKYRKLLVSRIWREEVSDQKPNRRAGACWSIIHTLDATSEYYIVPGFPVKVSAQEFSRIHKTSNYSSPCGLVIHAKRETPASNGSFRGDVCVATKWLNVRVLCGWAGYHVLGRFTPHGHIYLVLVFYCD